MTDYKYLLWDIDGTILDFLAAESAAIKKLFPKFGLGECTDEMVKRYSDINIRHWEALERGELTKPEVLVDRYREFFEKEGLPVSLAESFNSEYEMSLADTIVFLDNAYELLKSLKENHILAAVTNGCKRVQDRKLERSGLDKLFDYVFISEELGYEKPRKEFFDIALEKMGVTDKSEVLVIGDSLTSDIRGGNNAGIDTCWYNPKGARNTKGVNVTYEIKNLNEIMGRQD